MVPPKVTYEKPPKDVILKMPETLLPTGVLKPGMKQHIIKTPPPVRTHKVGYRRHGVLPILGWHRLILHIMITVTALGVLIIAAELLWSVIRCTDYTNNVPPPSNCSPDHESVMAKGCAMLGFHHRKPCSVKRPKQLGPIGPETCPMVAPSEKFDCLPGGPYDKKTCLLRGCCWKDGLDMPQGVPICFFPLWYGSYVNKNVTYVDGMVTVDMVKKRKSPYPKDVEQLRFEACYESPSRLHIKIVDAKKQRFEPRLPEVPTEGCHKLDQQDYSVDINESDFGFKILRKRDHQVIFDAANVGALIYADQFLQINGMLPAGASLYGIGEQQGPLAIDTSEYRTFTLWNHDLAPKDKANLYGSHPFLLIRDNAKTGSKWHGVFFLNSNALEIITQPGPSVTFRTIGGILNFYWFMGDTPDQVTSQYLQVIETPKMPPYWALGFHLCRYGYGSLQRTMEVWNRTRAAGIPFDVQWNDLDYMDKNNDFTYDLKAFAGLPQFVEMLHKVNMRYIPLIDPGISAGEEPGEYAPYDEGLKLGIFVTDESKKPFVGKVWNKVSTVWPDFTNPSTVDYWVGNLRKLHEKVAFDGAWIDMNEPSNFYDGTKNGCPNNNINNPPYIPAVDGGQLFYKTICPSARHYEGLHYDLHNLYGLTEAIVTSFAMTDIRDGKRPVVISRSSFPGHGHFAGVWTGDVFSTWFDLQRSIPQILNFNMFGVPFVGADICGFNGNTTVELCARWMQLGAFYPFSRNHNTDDAIDQDPVSLGETVTVAARNALKIRYSLLPYLYYLFYRAQQYGETVARPLFYEYPSDSDTFQIDKQFMWGSCVHIIPVLSEGATTVNGYLPEGRWYDWYTNKTSDLPSGRMVTLDAPLDKIPIVVRGGCVLPVQKPEATTDESRKNPVVLQVYLDEKGKAFGKFFWDDGESSDSLEAKHYTLLDIAVENQSLTSHVEVSGYADVPLLESVIIYGECKKGTAVTIDGDDVHNYEYDPVNCVLRIPVGRTPLTGFVLEWD